MTKNELHLLERIASALEGIHDELNYIHRYGLAIGMDQETPPMRVVVP